MAKQTTDEFQNDQTDIYYMISTYISTNKFSVQPFSTLSQQQMKKTPLSGWLSRPQLDHFPEDQGLKTHNKSPKPPRAGNPRFLPFGLTL